MSDDQDLDKLISRVDFYESSIEQLKKEIPKYLNKQLEMDKSHKSMAKTLRGVASSETNQKLQNLIFLYSQKQDLFDKERALYSVCEKDTHNMIEDARKLLILPLKDIISDHKNLAKTSAIAAAQQASSSGSSSSNSKKVGKNDLSDAQFVRSTLPIHVKMFEKHRVASLKTLLQTLLTAELRYHCRVTEELSAVLRDLALIGEDD